jgi:splicing factor 3A subunit 1
MFRLKEECSSINTILDQVKYRSEWIKYQEAQRRKEEEELEKERGRLVCFCFCSF